MSIRTRLSQNSFAQRRIFRGKQYALDRVNATVKPVAHLTDDV
jgi:hypothetical protein